MSTTIETTGGRAPRQLVDCRRCVHGKHVEGSLWCVAADQPINPAGYEEPCPDFAVRPPKAFAALLTTPCARCGCLATSHPVPRDVHATPGSVAWCGCVEWQLTDPEPPAHGG